MQEGSKEGNRLGWNDGLDHGFQGTVGAVKEQRQIERN